MEGKNEDENKSAKKRWYISFETATILTLLAMIVVPLTCMWVARQIKGAKIEKQKNEFTQRENKLDSTASSLYESDEISFETWRKISNYIHKAHIEAWHHFIINDPRQDYLVRIVTKRDLPSPPDIEKAHAYLDSAESVLYKVQKQKQSKFTNIKDTLKQRKIIQKH